MIETIDGRATSTVDVTDVDLYGDGIPHDVFRAIQRHPGLVWQPYLDNGFWIVSRYDDVKTVSKSPDVFSSAVGHTNLWDLEADALEARRSIIDTDAPDHTRLRRLVSRAFTPRNLLRWEETTRTIAAELLDRFVDHGGGDWVDKVAAPLPIRVILSILGVPHDDADHLVELSNYLVEGTGDRPTLPDDAFGNRTPVRLLPFSSPASHALFEYGERIGAQRRAQPQDDLVTQLVLAEDDGDRLSHDEYRNLFHVLVFAGNETTRTALSHGARALAKFPDQWHRLVVSPELVDSAVEEILRWSTPVLHMRRTATENTVLAGTEVAAGDKVVMWYAASNWDENVFPEPQVFNIGRDGQTHQAFGGGGPHFCLGAFLARMEIRVVLEEMLARGIKLKPAGELTRTRSNFVNGVLSLPVAC